MFDLIEKVDRLGRARVLLVGDFILDCYIYGDVERINPEAPVPVLKVVRRQSLVGGAGNVAAAVPALGSAVTCVGTVGCDAHGDELVALLESAGAGTEGLVRVDDRPTAVKTRFVGLAQHRHPQQMLRVDDESVEALPASVHDRLVEAVAREMPQADVVILEDYNKGLLTPDFAQRTIALARAAGIPVFVDPARIADYAKYRGASVLKPNRYEASLASGVEIADEASLEAAADRLMEVTGAEAMVISLDREGMYLGTAAGGKRIPHRCPRSVYDVTGAGDETLAVLAVARARGCSWEESVELANVAGGLEVEKFGFVPLGRQELIDEMRRLVGLRGGKVLDRHRLKEEVDRRRSQGEVIAFTNGCFDLLHMGHVQHLRQARQLAGCLIVAINSDAGVRRLKGDARPVINEHERAEMLGALECVDYVTVFDEDTPEALLDLLRPDMLLKGGTTSQVVGREFVEGYGGQVLTLDYVADLSTTSIINRIRGQEPAAPARNT